VSRARGPGSYSASARGQRIAWISLPFVESYSLYEAGRLHSQQSLSFVRWEESVGDKSFAHRFSDEIYFQLKNCVEKI